MGATSRIFQAIGDAIGSERVFGDTVTTDEITVIPVSRLIGGGGAGEGSEGEDAPRHADPSEVESGGGGFGVIARPVGVIVMTGTRVRWKPTIDVTRVILGGQVIGIAYFVSAWLIARTNAQAAVKLARVD